jgi:hypothetical protein
LNVDDRFAVFLLDIERPVFQITFDIVIVNFAPDQSFSVKDSVLWVGVEGVLGAIPDSAGNA